MKQIGLIFPDDLATNNKVLLSINPSDPLLIYEPWDTFYKLKHHKHKLVMLLSALRHWKEKLEENFQNIIHIKITKNRDIDLMHDLESLHKKINFDSLQKLQTHKSAQVYSILQRYFIFVSIRFFNFVILI